MYSSFHFAPSSLGIYTLHMVGAVLFTVIILEQNFAENSLLKLGGLRPFGFPGRVSYRLYMLHPMAMLVASVLLQHILHLAAPVVEGPVYTLSAFVLTAVLRLPRTIPLKGLF